jgi:N-acetylmuramoyl-L-alanine amidase
VFDVEEKHVNLDVALSLARILREKGHDARLTRTDDVFVELEERAALANRARADLFVSLHADSAENREARGFTVYVRRSASDGSRGVARAIERSLVEGGIESRGVREAGFRVLVRTRCPAVLVELGYLSNYGEAALLRSREYRDLLARRIAAGIFDWLAESAGEP